MSNRLNQEREKRLQPLRMKTAMEALTTASHKIAEVMYQQQAQQPGGPEAGPQAGPQPGSEKKDDDVVDAEFEDVN